MPEFIAHRGAPRERPENTLAAFLRALESHVDGIELDVHATADGVPVVHHDPVPRAAAGDASLAGRPIASLTAAQLRTFRLGGTEEIPTLADVLAAVRGRAFAYVEIKGRRIESAVVRTIRESGAGCAVHAFDHRVPLAVRALAPDLPTGILSTSYVLDPAAALRAAGARDYWQQWDLIDEALVRAVCDAGGRVMAWTVNAPGPARELAALGVAGLCSDVAGELKRALEGAP